jgi:hypothetical protein
VLSRVVDYWLRGKLGRGSHFHVLFGVLHELVVVNWSSRHGLLADQRSGRHIRHGHQGTVLELSND